MQALFIGGTGNISTAVSRLAVARGIDLFLLNRGRHESGVSGAQQLAVDVNDQRALARVLEGRRWDVVVNFIAFTEADVERDIALFRASAEQYVFISSASAYQKPPRHPLVTESTPLANPFWEYARNKIACEERLIRAYREHDFPVTIVRPSLTYDRVLPIALGGFHDFTLVERLRRGEPIVVHGDGTSLWTLTHSEDFARGFVGLLGNSRSVGHAFHITSDEWLTWNEIYEELARAAGARAQLVHVPTDFIVRVAPELRGTLLGDKAHSLIFDNGKIRSFVPDFRATIPFREGIRRTVAWFDERPERRTTLPENDRLLDRLLESYGHA